MNFFQFFILITIDFQHFVDETINNIRSSLYFWIKNSEIYIELHYKLYEKNNIHASPNLVTDRDTQYLDLKYSDSNFNQNLLGIYNYFFLMKKKDNIHNEAKNIENNMNTPNLEDIKNIEDRISCYSKESKNNYYFDEIKFPKSNFYVGEEKVLNFYNHFEGANLNIKNIFSIQTLCDFDFCEFLKLFTSEDYLYISSTARTIYSSQINVYIFNFLFKMNEKFIYQKCGNKLYDIEAMKTRIQNFIMFFSYVQYDEEISEVWRKNTSLENRFHPDENKHNRYNLRSNRHNILEKNNNLNNATINVEAHIPTKNQIDNGFFIEKLREIKQERLIIEFLKFKKNMDVIY